MPSFSKSLRAGRSLANLSQEKLAEMSGLSRAEIVRAENDELKLLPKSAYVLKAELEKQGIEFLEETPESGPGVRWKKPGSVDAFDAAKIRAARSMLGLSQTALAKLASSDRTFIYRIERAVAKSVDAAVLKKLRVALEGAGAEFIPESDQSGAGVRLRKSDERTPELARR